MSATCRSCGAPIIWAKHETTGRRMPFDAEPDPKGRWAMDDEDGGEGLSAAVTGRPADLIYYQATDEPPSNRYTSHFATCVHADQHRKGRRDHRG